MASVQRSGRLERGITSAVMDKEAQLSTVVSTRPPQRTTPTLGGAVDSMVRQIELFVLYRSGPKKVADTPQLQALLEDLTDRLATISKGDGNNEEDTTVAISSTVDI